MRGDTTDTHKAHTHRGGGVVVVVGEVEAGFGPREGPGSTSR